MIAADDATEVHTRPARYHYPPRLGAGARVTVFDSLRGLAATMVVWHHFCVLFPAPFAVLHEHSRALYSLAIWVSNQNSRAVELFFVLSGISIRLSLSNGIFSAPNSIANYARHRAARILPLYWLALGWTAVLGVVYGLNDTSFSLWNLAGNLMFLQTPSVERGKWAVPFGRNGPLWSLSYEAFYYILLPIVLAAVGRKRLPSSKFNILLIGSFITSLLAIGLGWGRFANPYTSFLSYWAVWMYGFVIGDLLLQPRAAYLLVVPAPICLVCIEVLRARDLHSSTLATLASGLCIASLFAALYYGWTILPRALSRTFKALLDVVFLRAGRGSYALYLLHYPVLLVIAVVSCRYRATPLFSAAGAIVVISVLALLFCPWLEMILRTPGRRLFGIYPRQVETVASTISQGIL